MGLNHSPPPSTSASEPPGQVQVTAALVTTATTSTTTAAISPGVQVSNTDTAVTSTVMASIPTMIPTVTAVTSPTMSTAWTPSHPKYRATLQTYVNPPEFTLPEDGEGEIGHDVSERSTPIFDDDASSVTSRKSEKPPHLADPPPIDPNPGMSFEERKKTEDENNLKFYHDQMRRMAPKAKAFQKAFYAMEDILEASKPKAEEAYQKMGELDQAWKEVKLHRRLAIAKLSYWTKQNDTYLPPREQMVLQIREAYFDRFLYFNEKEEGTEEKKADADLVMDLPDIDQKFKEQEAQIYFCDRCASSGFQTLQELQQHQTTHHQAFLQQQVSYQQAAPPQMKMTPVSTVVDRGSGNPVYLLNQSGQAIENGRNLVGMTCAFQPAVMQPNSTTMTSVLPSSSHYNPNNNNVLSTFDPMWQQRATTTYAPFHSSVPPINPNQPRYSGEEMFRRQVEDARRLPQQHDPTGQLISEMMTRAFSEQLRLTEENRAREWQMQEAFRQETARRQEELNFKKESEEICSIFNPDKLTNHNERMSEFNHWLSEANTMEKRMSELQFSGLKKYHALRHRLEGQAKTCTRIDFPNDDSYDRAINLLKERYYDKALAMREWFRKMKTLPKIPEEGHLKVNQAATEILNLMEQLENKKMTLEELQFLLFAEMIEPKLNKVGSETWEKMRNDKANDEAALGHDMVTDDLKRCLVIMRTKITNREFNRALNKDDGKPTDDWKKKQELKKKQEEERKAKSLYGQSTSNEAPARNEQPSNGRGTCPVEGCGAPLNPKEGGHSFVLYCPVLKKMPQQERWKFYQKSGSKCKNCFSISHDFDLCPVNRGVCDIKITKGPKEGLPCGKKHNRLLHFEGYQQRYRKNQDPSSNQTSTQKEDEEVKENTNK